MEKKIKRLFPLALALVLCLGLWACGGESGETPAPSDELTEDQAKLYVEGLLKETYLAESDPDFLELVGISEGTSQIVHSNAVQLELNYVVWLFEVEYPTDAFEEDMEEIYDQIFRKARFSVNSATREEDGSFSVEVEISPLNIINLVYSSLISGGLDDFYEKYPYEVQMAMNDEEYEAMDQEWAQNILEIYKAQMPYIGYRPARTLTVKLEKGEDGVYAINDTDFARINDSIIDYSDLVETEPETTPAPSPTPENEDTSLPSGETSSTASPAPAAEATTAPTATATPAPSTAPQESQLHHVEMTVKDYGTITLELDASAAPKTVENFLKLAREGFYDGLTFHRIMSGFMIQGGDPQGNGYGGSEETIAGEFASNGWDNPISHVRGVISMARSNAPDSASSQFFIVQRDATFLDGSYAAFGWVTDGMTVVDAICADAQPTDDNGTIPADQQPVITSVKVID